MTKNPAALAVNNYQQLLTAIREKISQTQEKIFKITTRQKVKMAWEIGQKIDQHLELNEGSGYGKKIFSKLADDVLISERALYQMHAFHQTYKKLPKDDEHLNWSHYRLLAGIKASSQRKYLENLARENFWDSDRLQIEVSKSKGVKQGSAQDSMQDGVCNPVLTFSSKSNQDMKVGTGLQTQSRAGSSMATKKNKKLNPTRGKLFSYKIAKLPNSKNYFFDCGFGIFTRADKLLPKTLRRENQIVFVEKNSDKFLVKKSAILPKKIHTYKADLKRVIDGDTLLVVLDLGFEIFHEEKLRLANINAAELNTDAGKNSAKILQKILKDAPFLIVKTNKTDIYGRYVADVFLPQKKSEKDLQKVADGGIYLNQLLFDRGAVVVF